MVGVCGEIRTVHLQVTSQNRCRFSELGIYLFFYNESAYEISLRDTIDISVTKLCKSCEKCFSMY
jgi:hypothetical protein